MTVNLSKFILMSAAVGFFGMHATTAFSDNSAKSWGNRLPNSTLLGGKINLDAWCVKPKSTFAEMNPNVGIIDFGAALARLTFPGNRTTVAVHIIPYVISQRGKARLYLIYKSGEFHRACRKKYNQKLARQHLGLYPLVLLHVAKENRAELATHLKNVRWSGFLSSKIDNVSSVRTVGDLLEKVFALKQAIFLKGLPFNVCVELIDERKKQNLKFAVQNVNGSVPSPCRPKKTAKPKTSQASQTTKEAKLLIKIKKLQERIAQLADEKQDMAKQLDMIDSELAQLMNQFAESHQQREPNADAVLDKEMKQLRKEVKKIQIKQAIKQSTADKREHRATGHKLIVVSLSAALEAQGKVIRESLNQVFSTLGAKTPFTLITVQTGRQLYMLLTDKEIPNLLSSSERSIQGELERGIQFGATDLRALDDLGLVDTFIQYKEGGAVKHVLYLTDNVRMSDDPADISRKQRGVPLAWHADGIALTVLTTKGCQAWENVKARCISWHGKTVLKRELNAFFQ